MVAMMLFLLTIGLTVHSVGCYINHDVCAKTDKLLGYWYIIRWAGNLPLPEAKLRSPLPPFVFAKNKIGYLEFRMNISKPIGCVEFKMAMNEAKNFPCYFTLWMWHYVAIKFLGGENFGVAYLNSKTNDVHQKMAMLMGASSHTQLCHVASWGTDTELLATFLSLPVSPFCGFWFSVRGICQPQHSYDHSCCFRPTSKHIHSFLAPFLHSQPGFGALLH
ncbi:uncharacterized protein LOC134486062 isoform X1 [Rattus norvegicus]|uniref:uncharacterized protein LOC134486062 isoform X1 n=1 Tax=Rattus norvegicus TaxID=10116 RepID=UPI002FD7D5C4